MHSAPQSLCLSHHHKSSSGWCTAHHRVFALAITTSPALGGALNTTESLPEPSPQVQLWVVHCTPQSLCLSHHHKSCSGCTTESLPEPSPQVQLWVVHCTQQSLCLSHHHKSSSGWCTAHHRVSALAITTSPALSALHTTTTTTECTPHHRVFAPEPSPQPKSCSEFNKQQSRLCQPLSIAD